jgi:hypothetical protein
MLSAGRSTAADARHIWTSFLYSYFLSIIIINNQKLEVECQHSILQQLHLPHVVSTRSISCWCTNSSERWCVVQSTQHFAAAFISTYPTPVLANILAAAAAAT